MADTPSYEMFTATNRHGAIAEFFRGLKVGVPTIVPEGFNQGTVRARAYSNAYGFPLSVRTLNGRLWVCRLKPEDVRS